MASRVVEQVRHQRVQSAGVPLDGEVTVVRQPIVLPTAGGEHVAVKGKVESLKQEKSQTAPSEIKDPRIAQSLEKWDDKSKPLLERLNHLGDLDTSYLDSIYNAGILEGVPNNNEYFRFLRNAYDRWESGDKKSPMARKMLDSALERFKKNSAQAVEKIKAAAASGKEPSRPLKDSLSKVAELYGKLAPGAVAEIEKSLNAAPAEKTNSAPTEDFGDDSEIINQDEAARRLGMTAEQLMEKVKKDPSIKRFRNGASFSFRAGEIKKLKKG